ncbi:MAG: hypothetical protein ACI9QN_000028 [Arcticibacterium sp.]|jgi:hypothetical protein
MEANKIESFSKDIDELIRLLVSIMKIMKGNIKILILNGTLSLSMGNSHLIL